MTAYKMKQLSDYQKSVAINALIMFTWWLAFNPGFYSADSFGVIEMVRKGDISSEGTAIWAIAIKFLTLNGSHPEIATLVFSQILACSVTLIAHSLFKGKLAIWCSALLCVTPIVGAMGITLWHDIPMTSGFLLVTSGVIRYMRKEPNALTLLVLGVTFSSFRYNGIPTLFVSLILLTYFFKSKRLASSILILIFLIGGTTAALDAKFSPPMQTQSDGAINWMRYDLSCYAASFYDDEFFLKEFNGKSDRSFWKSAKACTWFNDSDAFFERPQDVTEKIPSAWVALTKKEPLFVLTTHMKRHEYLNPLPFFGPPRVPFIHTTIEYPGQDIRFWNVELSEKLRLYPRAWNYFSYIFGYSGFWLVVVFFLAWRKRSAIYFGVGVLGLVLNSALFVFAIISDARFSLFVLIAAQLIVMGEFVKYVEKRWGSHISAHSYQKIDKI